MSKNWSLWLGMLKLLKFGLIEATNVTSYYLSIQKIFKNQEAQKCVYKYIISKN